MSSIKLDTSSTGVVIHCTTHTWYHAFRFTKEAAWDAACDHEAAEHPDETHQQTARRVRKHRARVVGM